MRNRLPWLAGAVGVAAAAAYRIVRRKPRPSEDETDPRAEELRRRLDESRSMVEEREEFESAETPVDRVEPEAGVDERRREVHEQGRNAIEEMRPPDS
jgi:hypothetical protein